jgi:integrator complex subunit 11
MQLYVSRSTVLNLTVKYTLGSFGVLLLCHCSFQRRFPDFSYITQQGRLTEFLDCVIIRFVVFIWHLDISRYYSSLQQEKQPYQAQHKEKELSPAQGHSIF